MLFRMVKILFELFVGNSNGELRRTAVIPSSPQNSRIVAILTVPEQHICIWIHNCYSYSENNNYSAIPSPSKHTHRVCLDRAKNSIRIEELRIANEDSEKIVIFRLTRG
jgi:hypothetical protein